LRPKRPVPDGLWVKCESCNATVFGKQVEQNLGLCPECGHHFYVSGQNRIQQLLDEDSFEEWFADMTSVDPLGFTDKKSYKVRLVEEQKRTGLKDACLVGKGHMRGRPLVFGLTDSAFIMGSMGSVVGEKLIVTSLSGLPSTPITLTIIGPAALRGPTEGPQPARASPTVASRASEIVRNMFVCPVRVEKQKRAGDESPAPVARCLPLSN